MAGPDSTDEARPNRLLPVLFWVGVGLAPVAALLLLLGQSNGTLRIAAVLAILCVVLIGLSVVLGGNAETLRNDLEDFLRDDLDALRGEVRGEIANATHSSQQAVGERLRALQHSVEMLRGQLDAVRAGAGPVPRTPEGAPGVPRPPEPTRAAVRVPEGPRAAARVPEASRAAVRVPEVPRAAARVPERGPGSAAPDLGAHAARSAAGGPYRPAEPDPGGHPAPSSAGGPYRSAERPLGGQHTGDPLAHPGAVPVVEPPVGRPVGGRAQVPPPATRGAAPPPDAGRSTSGPFRRPEDAPPGPRPPTVERSGDVSGPGHRYAGAGYPEPDAGQANWPDRPQPGLRSAPPATAGERDARESGWADEQRHGRAAEAADDPADVEFWSGLRAGGRWASTDEQEPGVRTGDQRPVPGTDPRYEDRWAAIRDDDPRYPQPPTADPGRDRHRRDDEWSTGDADPTDGGRVLANARRRYDDEYGYPPDDDVPRAGGARRQPEPDYRDDRWR